MTTPSETLPPKLSMHENDPLEDFHAREITLNDVAKRVYTAGSGPAVIVMTEMPGISPHVARFSRWVRDAGFTVYMPSLFDRLIARVLPDDSANTDVAPFFERHIRCPHSVVTAHLIDAAGQPTINARDEILRFFCRQLSQ